MVDLGPASPVNEAVRAFLQTVRRAEANPAAADERESSQKLAVVAKLVIEPVAHLTKGRRQLIICPSGQLSLVPFECLTSADGKYLIEDHAISTTTLEKG